MTPVTTQIIYDNISLTNSPKCCYYSDDDDDIYCSWVYTRWQWSVVLYKNRKATEQKEKQCTTQTKTIQKLG